MANVVTVASQTETGHPAGEPAGDAPMRRGVRQRATESLPVWLIKQLVVQYLIQGLGGMAAQASFRLTITLPSLLLLLMTVAGLADQYAGVPVAKSVRDIIEQRAPEDLKPLFSSLLDQATNQSGLVQLTPEPRPQVAVESYSEQLAAGTYLIFIHGRAGEQHGQLSNASSNRVGVTLEVTSP